MTNDFENIRFVKNRVFFLYLSLLILFPSSNINFDANHLAHKSLRIELLSKEKYADLPSFRQPLVKIAFLLFLMHFFKIDVHEIFYFGQTINNTLHSNHKHGLIDLVILKI